MLGRFEKSGSNETSIFRKWGTGFLVLPALLALALFLLAIVQPKSNWISEAVQAEFTGNGVIPEIAPTQLARPSMATRTVRAN